MRYKSTTCWNSVAFTQNSTSNNICIIKYRDQCFREIHLSTLDSSDKWVESDRLFVKWNGEPMNNQPPYGWLKEFCEKNDMPFYGIHSFRHFAASALISSGLDVVTISGALGHCNSGTTLNVYAHMFQTAQARVAQAMDGAFSFLPQDTTT
ncbi:MAG: tyrosine-type recombinase/integrase [Oscillospiraceae bacterium]|nr:tyrosine-type recombinase/integrase [Oscillospiraceae bacterium]